MLDVIRPFGGHGGRADGSVVGEVEVWVWRDDLGSGGALGGAGGWRLDGNNTWVWEEPSPLDRPGAGTGALRGYAGGAGALPSSTSDGRSGVRNGARSGRSVTGRWRRSGTTRRRSSTS